MGVQQVTDEQIVDALKKNGGFMQMAADALGITRQGLWKRISESESLTEAKEQIRQGNLDLAESVLLKLVKKGHFHATSMLLKCLARDRGYEDRQRLDIENRGEVHLHVHPATGTGEQT